MVRQLALALALVVSGCQAPVGTTTAGVPAGLKTFHDPTHGLAIDVPASWTLVDAGLNLQFSGPDGWMSLVGNEGPVLAAVPGPLEDVGHAHERFTVDGQTVHVVTPRFGDEPAYADLLLPTPILRRAGATPEASLTLRGDARHLGAIAHSLRFERDGASYAQGVLGLLEAFHFRRTAIDWPARAQRVTAAAQGAAGPAEALAALRLATEDLGEHHTGYFDAATWNRTTASTGLGTGVDLADKGGRQIIARVRPGSPAEAAGLQPGDVIVGADVADKANRLLTVRYTRPGAPGERSITLRAVESAVSVMPTLRILDGAIAYLEVPGYVELDPARAFNAELTRLVASARAAGVRSWIIDVRRNSGGLFGEMLPALTPVMGDGRFGGIESALYGTSFDVLLGGEIYSLPADQLPDAPPTNPPVAVLTSPMTASAGEIVAAAFVGKPKTRTFGEPTAGLFTQMRGFPLWDGAYLNVAVGRALDAAGQAHDGPLVPDEAIETTFVGFGTDADPVLQRARAWLTTVAAP